jgi:glycine oxidase
MSQSQHDVLIIGAGVIGLSLAWELSNRGQTVHVIDANLPGREASWAGGGILPDANLQHALDPLDKLRGLSRQLHPIWSDRLKLETGIDNHFEVCGGVHVARRAGEAATLAGLLATLPAEGIAVEKLDSQQLRQLEPALKPEQFLAAYYLPNEAVLHNPRHLQALLAACEKNGVLITPHCAVTDIPIDQGHIHSVPSPLGSLRAKQMCITAGAWSAMLLQKLNIQNGIVPIRGQMLLYQTAPGTIQRVINEGSRYVIPRRDGHILVGSCEEEVGFEKGTTQQMLDQLADFAGQLVAALNGLEIKQSWSGLRPASFDGRPYLGRITAADNLFIAAGHFRNGLLMSPATAVVMADLMTGETPVIDLSHFSILRNNNTPEGLSPV